MKEIIYKENLELEVVEEGEYKGVKYAILSRGIYPTAYVEDILGAKNFTDEILEKIDVHCGFSFCDTPYWKNSREVYLGWDYGHICDYQGNIKQLNGKKWTYEEIIEEVHSVIEQLLKIEKPNPEAEQEIQEMAEIIDKARERAMVTVGSLNEGFGMWYARKLYDKGYRKINPCIDFVVRAGDISTFIENARKEAAKEILQAWYNDAKGLGLGEMTLTYIKNFGKREYGVEVEE